MKIEVSDELVQLARDFWRANDELEGLRTLRDHHGAEQERLEQEVKNKRENVSSLRTAYWNAVHKEFSEAALKPIDVVNSLFMSAK